MVNRDHGLYPVPQSPGRRRFAGVQITLDSVLRAEIVVQPDASPNINLEPHPPDRPHLEAVEGLSLPGVDEPDSAGQIHPFPRAEFQGGLKTYLPQKLVGIDDADGGINIQGPPLAQTPRRVIIRPELVGRRPLILPTSLACRE